METQLSLGYGLAIFAASNLVSLPVGFVTGFLEAARKRSLSRSTALVLEALESMAEVAAWIAITVHLLRRPIEHPTATAVAAYALAATIGYVIDVRVLKRPAAIFWVRAVATASLCIVVSSYVA